MTQSPTDRDRLPEEPAEPAVLPSATGHIFTREGQDALALRDQMASLSEALEGTADKIALGPADAKSDEDTDLPEDGGTELGDAELVTGHSVLHEELEARATQAPSQPKPAQVKPPTVESPPAAPPEPPINRLEPLFDVDPATVSLEYGSLFADPDPDNEEVLRIEDGVTALRILEGYLFATAEPLTLGRLSKLTGLQDQCLETLLRILAGRYELQGGGLRVQQLAGGFQLGTAPDMADWMIRLQKQKRRPSLSNPALECLAIIAYRQPITRGEIEAIRGVDSSGALRSLQDLNLIEIGGRKDVVGRPSLYITNDGFLRTFGLMSLQDLPPITELKKDPKIQEDLSPKAQPPQVASVIPASEDMVGTTDDGEIQTDVSGPDSGSETASLGELTPQVESDPTISEQDAPPVHE